MSAVDFAAFIVARLPNLTATPTGRLKCPGHKFSTDAILLADLLKAIPDADRMAALELAGGVDAIANPAVGASLRKALVSALGADQGGDGPVDFTQINFSSELPIPLSELKWVFNFHKQTQSFLYWEKKDAFYQFDYEAVTYRLKALLGKASPAWEAEHSFDCLVGYAPNGLRVVPPSDSDSLPTFNTWTAAPWAKGWEPPAEKTPCPPEVAAYLDAMTGGDKPTVRYLEAWLRDATFSRAKSVLVLAGAPGCGKNVFVEHLAAALVGKLNFNKAASGFKSKDQRFQASITGYRLFFLDEVYLDDSARDTLKVYHNNEATFERKGVEVGRMEKIHASIVLANNYLSKVKLEFSDRKFYVPVLAKKSLDETLGAEAKDKLLDELLKDDGYVRAVADYLYSHYKEGASAKFPKTGLFKTLCINSYPAQFRVFIDHCRRTKRVNAKLANKRSKTPYGVPEIEALIEHYETNFGEKLATIVPGSIGTDWEVESHLFNGVDETETL